MRRAVEALAEARVRDDVAAFASYMTPQAVLQLGGNGMGAPALPRPGKFEVIDITGEGGGGSASVRFSGRGVSYELRTRWQLVDGMWKAVEAEVPAASVRTSWWRRLFRGSPSAPPKVERRDLS